MNKLKHYITGSETIVEGKYKDSKKSSIYSNIYATTNLSKPLRIVKNNRRFVLLKCVSYKRDAWTQGMCSELAKELGINNKG